MFWVPGNLIVIMIKTEKNMNSSIRLVLIIPNTKYTFQITSTIQLEIRFHSWETFKICTLIITSFIINHIQCGVYTVKVPTIHIVQLQLATKQVIYQLVIQLFLSFQWSCMEFSSLDFLWIPSVVLMEIKRVAISSLWYSWF